MAIDEDAGLREIARAHLLESAQIKQQVAEQCLDSILAAANLIAVSFRRGGKLLLCGNGGSAADCQHLAAEFVGRLTCDLDRAGLPAIALTTDTSFLTAQSNDRGFESVFERQVQALGQAGDILLGISTSGNSENVIRALAAAYEAKMQAIVLTGKQGRLRTMGEVVIAVPSVDTHYIQEAHIAIEHILCELVEHSI